MTQAKVKVVKKKNQRQWAGKSQPSADTPGVIRVNR